MANEFLKKGKKVKAKQWRKAFGLAFESRLIGTDDAKTNEEVADVNVNVNDKEEDVNKDGDMDTLRVEL